MASKPMSPDLILYHGRIYTMDPATPAPVQAAAIKAGRFVALGDDDEIRELAGPGTRLLDLEGKSAVPGLFDSHAHVMEMGQKLAAVRLDECRSPSEMMSLVRQRAQQTPPGDWIIGMGWNEAFFDEPVLPTRQDIDPATSQHPVLLQRFFNADVANSVALDMAGIGPNTPDPPGGRIERDAGGLPTGLLRASAKKLVRSLLPQPSLTQLAAAIRLGIREMNQFGITSVVEPGLTPDGIRAYQQVRREGGLKLRVNLMPSWHGFFDNETPKQLHYRATETGMHSGLGDEWLRLGGLKMALDGGTTSRTAYMYQPFQGEDVVVDYNRLDLAQLEEYFRQAHAYGWDIGIHVCGDRALDMAVGAMARAVKAAPRPDARHNMIHAYFPSDESIALMARHRIATVLQPTFIYWEGDQVITDVGEARAANYKPARKLLDRGVLVSASSDVPSTVSANPFIALYALVSRRDRAGHLIAGHEAITRLEALRAYTVAGTWLTREESLKGSVGLGKVADLAILDRDYFQVPVEEIREIQAIMTLVGGEIVWQR